MQQQRCPTRRCRCPASRFRRPSGTWRDVVRVRRWSTPGGLYNCVAKFGNFIVIVTADALVLQEAPVVHLDTMRAREFAVQTVTLVRG
ncbi:MAG: DUF5642 family protein [Mycobacterium sp.]